MHLENTVPGRIALPRSGITLPTQVCAPSILYPKQRAKSGPSMIAILWERIRTLAHERGNADATISMLAQEREALRRELDDVKDRLAFYEKLAKATAVQSEKI